MKIGILTSGGDSPGMNAAVRAVVRFGIARGMKVYGIYRGYEGLIDGELEELDRRAVGDILQRGGTMLKTARSERFMTEAGRRKAVTTIETFGLALRRYRTVCRNRRRCGSGAPSGGGSGCEFRLPENY